MKYKAIDYKGKYFIIEDADNVSDEMDFTLPYIDVESIVNNDINLKNHVAQCLYYGIPAYIGSNKELKLKIDNIYEELK